MRRLFVIGLVLAAIPSFAAAQYGSNGSQQMDQMAPAPRGFSGPEERYKADVRKLRADAMKLQKQDGGHLSDAHKSDLQARLDLLNKEACAKGVKSATCPPTPAG
jgi:hypothetical protein